MLWPALSSPSPPSWARMFQLKVFQPCLGQREKQPVEEAALPGKSKSILTFSLLHDRLWRQPEGLLSVYFLLPGHITLMHSLEAQQQPGSITLTRLPVSPPQSVDQAHGSTLKCMTTCPLQHPPKCKEAHFASKYYTHACLFFAS